MKPCPSNNKSVKRRDISRRELFINRETTLEPPINTFGGPFLVKKKKKKKKKEKKKTVLGSNVSRVGFTAGKRGRETQAVASRGQGA